MRYLILFLVVISWYTSNANITLPAVLNDNMVLQQQSNVKLWGWSDAAEKIFITTSWNNKTDSTKGDGNAKWVLSIKTPSAGGPYTITIKGNNTIVLHNVLIGEVWICSGQSNMEMNYYWGLPQMKEDFPTALNPNIRFFSVPRTTAQTPQENLRGTWATCDSNTVKSFSAAAYYFGRKLNAELNVPIGLIHVSWGGTPAEAWTPAEVVNNNSTLNDAAKKLNPSQWWPTTPGYAYNGMIAPLTNFSIAGAIWYQGESNTGTAATYEQLFSSMIEAWRKNWSKQFPFYYVQLAPYHYGNQNIAALLREQQLKTLSLSKTGMAVINDLPVDTMDIHPKDKRSVGYRLANIALSQNYGRNIPGALSPLYKTMNIDKDRIVLSFDNADGLTQKGKIIIGFYIAGADRNFYPADVKINGNTIIVWNRSVPQPVAVRYAFSNAAIGNIFNKEGLPLSPFRTDNWDVDTSPIK
jgi:sialate O-acetylesterase